jgi:MFS family permease
VGRRALVALLLSAGATYALSQTLILPAMPALVRELGASPAAVSWLLTAYLVSASVATPLIGRLGDLLGRGRVLAWVMAVFCAGSVVCAVGDSLPLLVIGRALQGAAGGVFPLAYGIIRDSFPAETRMQAIGLLSVSLGVGAALGPPLAGVIVDHAGPSAIFWPSIVGALPALAAARLVPDARSRRGARIDWLGAAVLAGALTAVLVLLTQGEALGWTSPAALALAAGGAALAAAWIAVERRQAAPLVDVRALARPALACPNLAALLIGCAIFMAYVPLAAIAQAPTSTGYGFGWSVAAAGALLIPHGIVQVVAGPLAGRLCATAGPRAALLLGTTIEAAAIAVIALLHRSPLALITAATALGVGQGLALTAMANAVVVAVPHSEVGSATGINSVMRTVGMALGSALSAAILAGGVSAGAFAPEHAYVTTFVVAACVMTGAVAAAAALPRRVAVPAAVATEGRGAVAPAAGSASAR